MRKINRNIIKKKVRVVFILTIGLLCLFLLLTSLIKAKQKVIVIQPGHAVGYDTGATSDYITEAEVNELLAVKLMALLDQRGYKVYLTHCSNPTYQDRTLISVEEADTLKNIGPAMNAVNPDLAISIHHNSTDSKAVSGTEIYWSSYRDYDTEGVYVDPLLWSGAGGYKDTSPCSNAQQSLRLATIVRNHLNGFSLPFRKIVEREDYLPAHANAPCILVEGGYLSNPTEAAYIASESYQNDIVSRLYEAIDEFFDVNSPPTNVQISSGAEMLTVGSQVQLSAYAIPTDNMNSEYIWTSQDPTIASVENGIVTANNPGETVILVAPVDNPSVTSGCKITVLETPEYNILFSSKVRDTGWLVADSGNISGTTGQSKVIDAFQATITDINKNPIDAQVLGIAYRSHVQNIGWQNYAVNNEISGTESEALQLEAFQAYLIGEQKDNYDLFYRTHISDIGWTGWSKNNEPSGSEGYAKGIEAVQMILLPKNALNQPSDDEICFYTTYGDGAVRYQVHIENHGWTEYTPDNTEAGFVDSNQKLEALRIIPNPNLPYGDILADAYVEENGWQGYQTNLSLIGTTGQNLGIESLRFELTDNLAEKFDIHYQVYIPSIGWSSEVANGQDAGSAGSGQNIEAVKIWIVEK